MLLALGAASCATIVSDSTYPVTIRSTPDRADFVIHDEDGAEVHRGVTPATVDLKAGSSYFDREEYDVTVSAAGMGPKTRHLRADLDPWFFGNILFGGLIGILIVDPLTGAMYELDDELTVNLDPVQP